VTDGERNEVTVHMRQAVACHLAVKHKEGEVQIDLCELLKHILNILKRVAGDQAPPVE